MNEPGNDLPSDIRALLDSERAVQPLAAGVRARAVGRARAAMVVGEIAVLRRQTDVTLGGRLLATCLSVAAALAIAAGTYQLRAHLGERAIAAPARPLNPRPATPSPPTEASATAGLGAQPSFPASRQESRLLRLARAAMARQDFASALLVLAEHARRFRDGSLAEEREVLRLRALVGLVLTSR
ncbi:MAG TPA: hypothetical protein VN962_04860 [Polyangia bacterium]|nr:hypothetical protein [Polyangia bacterium]